MRSIGRKNNFRWLALGLILLVAATSSACRLHRLARQLPPEYAEFYSQVRYIITKEEEKIFLELPDAEKDKFIDEFWTRRDPDPDTEENEFKMEYYDRIEMANELFVSEGRPGWLTDRGRIYILFGPPTDRITDSMGGEYGVCQDVWYYGNFPVVFRDPTCTGDFKLITYNLTALRELNLMYMHELSMAQIRAQKTFSRDRAFFDFSWRLTKKSDEPGRIEGQVELEIPYAGIWFKEEDGLLKTTFEVRLELRDSEGELFWEHADPLEFAITEAELKGKMKASFEAEIPFLFEDNLERLRRGKNKLHLRLKNLTTGGEELRKVMTVSF